MGGTRFLHLVLQSEGFGFKIHQRMEFTGRVEPIDMLTVFGLQCIAIHAEIRIILGIDVIDDQGGSRAVFFATGK